MKSSFFYHLICISFSLSLISQQDPGIQNITYDPNRAICHCTFLISDEAAYKAQFHYKLMVLSSDVAVQGYTLLNGIFLDHLSFLISQNRLLRQLEDFRDHIFFYHNVVPFQIIIKGALYPYLISHQLNFQGLTKI